MIENLFEYAIMQGDFSKFLSNLTPQMEGYISKNLGSFLKIVCKWRNLFYIRMFLDRFNAYNLKDHQGKPYVFEIVDFVEENFPNRSVILAIFNTIKNAYSIVDRDKDNVVAYAYKKNYRSSLPYLLRFVKDHYKSFNIRRENTVFLFAREQDPMLQKTFWSTAQLDVHDLLLTYNNDNQTPVQIAVMHDNHIFFEYSLKLIKEKSGNLLKYVEVINEYGVKNKCLDVLVRYVGL